LIEYNIEKIEWSFSMKIAVAGTGYVGLSLATLLSQHNEVVALDILEEKINMINNRISPIRDEYIEKYFKEKNLNLKATLDYKEAFRNANFVIVSTPTNYDEKTKFFDTSSVEDVIKKVINMNDKNITIVIKSTVPVGFIEYIRKTYNISNIFFSPEFLREGKALYDNLYPSRIIIGENSEKAKIFANLLKTASLEKNVPILFMNSTEAEAVKLFANTYLALRVSYFNELDTYAELKGLNTKNIIEGVCLDSRIGNHYNNPSFGYGGYCLPKDTKQLKESYDGVPEKLITAIVDSNNTRKEHIISQIIAKNPKTVGIFRLTMKSNSDNFRNSAIQDVIKKIKEQDIKIIIYELSINENYFLENKVVNNLNEFKRISDIIITNRYDNILSDVNDKIYTRDIYNRD
jgi:nucleotide sugar dehydrogenase